MPNYSSHLIFNFIILCVLFILYQLAGLSPTILQLALFLFFYFLGSVILTPDLDSKSEASKRCGIVCMPYRKIFKHRGASHHWLWGLVARIAYVLIISAIILLVLGITFQEQELGVMWQIVGKYKLEVLAGIGGLFFSNVLHIFLDKIA